MKESAQREFFIQRLGNNFVQMRFGKRLQKGSDNSRYKLKHFYLHKYAFGRLGNFFHQTGQWER